MDYQLFVYFYKSNDNTRFLFGFISKAENPLGIEAFPTTALDPEISIEIVSISQNTLSDIIQQLEQGICNLENLGIKTKFNAMGVLYKTASYLNPERSNPTTFTLNPFRSYWLEDYSDLENWETKKLLDKLHLYASPFFIKNPFQPYTANFPIGSLLILENSLNIHKDIVTTQTGFKANDNGKYEFSFVFKKFVDAGYTARVVLTSIPDNILVNEIFPILEPNKTYTLSEPIPNHLIEIFDSEGKCVYYDHRVRIVSISGTLTAIGKHTQVNDQLTQKNKRLTSIKSKDITTGLDQSALDSLPNEKFKIYCKEQERYRKLALSDEQKPVIQQNIQWFEKMYEDNAMAALQNITENSTHTYIFDPYFSSFESPTKTGKRLNYQEFQLLYRLTGKITVITEQANKTLLDVANSLEQFYRSYLSLTIKSASRKFHDRYILAETTAGHRLYLLSTSLSAVMKDEPLCLIEILGDAKNQVISYLNTLKDTSNDLFISKPRESLPQKEWHSFNYVLPLLPKGYIPSSPIDTHIWNQAIDLFNRNTLSLPIKILGLSTIIDLFNCDRLPLSIKILGLSVIYEHAQGHDIYESYTGIIRQYKDKIDLKEIENYLINKSLFIPKVYQIVRPSIPNKYSIEAYQYIETWIRLGQRWHHRSMGDTGLYSLMPTFFYINTDTFIKWFEECRHYELLTNALGCIGMLDIDRINVSVCLNVNNQPFTKILGLYVLLSSQKEKQITEEQWSLIISSGIPQDMLFTIFLYESQEASDYSFVFSRLAENKALDIGKLTKNPSLFSIYKLERLEIFCRYWGKNHKAICNILTSTLNEEERSIWYKLATDFETLSKLTKILESIPPESTESLLKSLASEMKLGQDANIVSLPIARDIFSYGYRAIKEQKICIMLALFGCLSQGEYAIGIAKKMIKYLAGVLYITYPPNFNLISLLISIFFQLLVEHDELKDDKEVITFINLIAEISHFKLFYHLYNKEGVETIKPVFEDYLRFLKLYENKAFSNDDEKYLLHTSFNTLFALLALYPDTEMRELSQFFISEVNTHYKGKFSIERLQKGDRR